MECFNDFLLKLREVHEREVEGWQVKVQELSNKKGCDTKRMEELFTRNQQMKEQQRLLTENIKTLENRLRAGLCDRCTVTQEVAKRRQQEFEASQIQTLQHISLLATEMNSLKKENKRLRDEIRNLRGALDTATETKPHSSPDRSPSSGPVALVSAAAIRASNQPGDGEVAVKTEADHRTEETESRPSRRTNQSLFESYKSILLPTGASPWKMEPGSSRAAERRTSLVEGLDQRPLIPPQALLKTSTTMSGEVKQSRHVLHAPVPCHPQPIKSSSVSLPWPLSESSDWMTMAAGGSNPALHPSPRLSIPHFPNLIPTSQQVSPRRQVFSSPWQKHNAPQPPAKEPTVVFRLSNFAHHTEYLTKHQEKKESPPPKVERVSEERLSKEACDGPLDLSDRGKSKSSQTDGSPLALQGRARVQKSPDIAMNTNPSANTPVSSPSPMVPSSSSSTPTVKQELEASSKHNHKQVVNDQEESGEVNGKTEPSNDKKVPVLTISLRPVVVLETLNSALQKQESFSSNGKPFLSPGDEPGSSTDDQEEEEEKEGEGKSSGQESGKRKRASVETETDRDSDTGNIHPERKMTILMRAEGKSPC